MTHRRSIAHRSTTFTWRAIGGELCARCGGRVERDDKIRWAPDELMDVALYAHAVCPEAKD